MLAPWWQRWKGVLEEELGAFESAGLHFTVDEHERAAGRIVLRGTAPAGPLGSRHVAVVYPDTFPDTRPAVYFTDGAPLDQHQNPFTGNLCLLGRESDQWRPSMRAASLVEDIPRLVGLVLEGGEALRDAEDPQGEPFSAYYHYTESGVVIVPERALRLPPNAQRGSFEVAFRSGSEWMQAAVMPSGGPRPAGQALLVRVRDERGLVVAEAEPELARRFGGRVWQGAWVRLEKPLRAADGSAFAQALGPYLSRSDSKPRNKRGEARFALYATVFEEDVQRDATGLAWVFAAIAMPERNRRGGDKPAGPQRPLGAALFQGMRLSPSDLSARIPELWPLPRSVATVLGLGTLGGPVALELGRAQIGELRIGDFDAVEAGTAVRWPGGLDAAGVLKTVWVKAEVERHHPYVRVVPMHLRVGDAPLERSPGWKRDTEILEELIAGSGVIVEATAEDNVSRAVSQVADGLGVPQVYVWGVDGFGGVIVRVVPGRTGCYHCATLWLSPEHGRIAPPPSAADGPQRRVQPPGCADRTFTASATDLMPLAVQASRIAIATLCEDYDDAYPAIEHNVFVLGLRAADGTPFSAPQWESYGLDRHPACKRCQDVPPGQ